MIPVLTQLLQLVIAVVAILLALLLRGRAPTATAFGAAGGLALLAGAAFQILWLHVIAVLVDAGPVRQAYAGALAAQLIEAVLEGAGWLLLALAAFAGRRRTGA